MGGLITPRLRKHLLKVPNKPSVSWATILQERETKPGTVFKCCHWNWDDKHVAWFSFLTVFSTLVHSAAGPKLGPGIFFCWDKKKKAELTISCCQGTLGYLIDSLCLQKSSNSSCSLYSVSLWSVTITFETVGRPGRRDLLQLAAIRNLGRIWKRK